MNSKKMHIEEDLKYNGSLTEGNNEKRLPFGVEYYNMKNDHSLTVKDDDNNCSYKEQEKKRLIITESQGTFEETYPKYRDKNFNTKEDQQEFNILNDILKPCKCLDTNNEGYNKTKLVETNKKNKIQVKHDRDFVAIFLIKSMRHVLGSINNYIVKVIDYIDVKITLGSPVIPNEYVKNTIGKEKILKMNIKEIYCIKNEKNRWKIEELLSMNVEGKEDEMQLLRLIFNIKYEKIFLRFMNDKPYITIMNNFKKEKIKLFGFETFSNVFLDYDEKAKQEVKLKAFDLIGGKIKKRKPRNKKNH